jgi:RES domain
MVKSRAFGSRIAWPAAYRILASRYPPIHLFERLTADTSVWDALIALEQKVNPRVRDQLGEIRLVPKEQRVSGPGASWVMAAFTHVNPKGSRFSDGSYGVYYAGKSRETAIRETVFHFEQFARDSADPPRSEDMRVLVSRARGDVVNALSLPRKRQREVLAASSYEASRAWALHVRASGASGIVYPSVRHQGGLCVAAFKPTLIGSAKEERRLQYHWDGTRVDRYFDYKRDVWVSRSA